MRAVGRIFAAIIGYLVAVVAAALFLMVARVGFEPRDPAMAGWFWSQFALYGGFAASLIGSATFFPAIVVILVTEVFSIRSWPVYALVGGGFGLAAALGVGSLRDLPADVALTFAPNTTLLLGAGFIGGMVYWLLAGRMAGLAPPRAGTPDRRPAGDPQS